MTVVLPDHIVSLLTPPAHPDRLFVTVRPYDPRTWVIAHDRIDGWDVRTRWVSAPYYRFETSIGGPNVAGLHVQVCDTETQVRAVHAYVLALLTGMCPLPQAYPGIQFTHNALRDALPAGLTTEEAARATRVLADVLPLVREASTQEVV